MDHSKTFLIRTASGMAFVLVFSSGQFASIRGTVNPSCVQPLNHPRIVHKLGAVRVNAYSVYQKSLSTDSIAVNSFYKILST